MIGSRRFSSRNVLNSPTAVKNRRTFSHDIPNHHFIKYFCESIAPFCRKIMTVNIEHMSKGKLTLRLPFKDCFVGNTRHPCLHGGVTAALVDHCGGFCAWTVLTDTSNALSTVDLRIDYLSPAPCEDMICDALVLHQSNHLIRTDMVCWNSSRTKKIAIARGLYNIYPMKILRKYQSIISRLFQTFPASVLSLLGSVGNLNIIMHRMFHTKSSIPPQQVSASGMTGPHHKESFCDMITNLTPYGRSILGVQVETVEPGKLTLRMPFKSIFTGNPMTPCLHGGVTAALLDHCGGFCAWSTLTDPQKRVSTVDLRVDYLAPAISDQDILCDAIVTHESKSLIRTDMVCWNADRTKKLVAGRAAFNIYSIPAS